MEKKTVTDSQLARDVLDSQSGRALLTRMAKKFHVLDPHIPRHGFEGAQYNEGQRSVVLWLLRQLNRKDAVLLGLIQEGIMETTNNE
jgi:hypothetical protein